MIEYWIVRDTDSQRDYWDASRMCWTGHTYRATRYPSERHAKADVEYSMLDDAKVVSTLDT